MSFKFYKVGGCVRDSIMGRRPKDIDLVCFGGTFEELKQDILSRGGRIFVERPQFLTLRCLLPDIGSCDVSIARKDGFYSDSRRPDSVEYATGIEEELSRRDFTMNAIAQNLETGEYIDPYNGLFDIKDKLIRSVGNPMNRLKEDPLRAFRAFRFSTVLDFSIDTSLYSTISILNPSAFEAVSKERVYEELKKAFEHDKNENLIEDLINTFRILYIVAKQKGVVFRPKIIS